MNPTPERVAGITAEHPAYWIALVEWVRWLWRPGVRHPRLGPGGQALRVAETRQLRRQLAFRLAWDRVNRLHGAELRKARRLIAWTWARRGVTE